MSPVKAFTLNRGTAVTIAGEAWDSGCNQWMQVRTERGTFWMNGNTLANTDVVTDRGEAGVAVVCQGVDWVGTALIGELIPLAPDQYKTATVTGNGVNVRDRPGKDANAPFTFNQGAPVEIMGETFDGNCDQWMQVTTDREPGIFWIHGDFLQNQPIGDDLPPALPAQALITMTCNNAAWTEGFQFYELIALAESQYKPATVTENNVRLRSGVGFDAPEVRRLSQGTPVIITGEAWDTGCNQWMQVQVDGRRSWISGNYIQ